MKSLKYKYTSENGAKKWDVKNLRWPLKKCEKKPYFYTLFF